MAHVTRCPYCGSVWLLPDALTAQRGPVKCSECHHSFDATCDLLEVPDSMFPEPGEDDSQQFESHPGGSTAADHQAHVIAPRIQTPPVSISKAGQPFIPTAVPASQPIAPDEPIVQGIVPAADQHRQDPSLGDLASLKRSISSQPERIIPQEPGTAPAAAPETAQPRPAPRPDFDRPRAQRHGRSHGSSGLSIMLTLLLLILAVAVAGVIFNQRIIQKYPQSDPFFAKVCRTVPCPGYCYSDIEAFSVTRSTLRALDAEHQFLLEATLTNTSSVEQKIPNLNILFLDSAGETLLRRTVVPEEYLELPAGSKRFKGLPGGKALTVRFTLTSSVAPARSLVTPSYEQPKREEPKHEEPASTPAE